MNAIVGIPPEVTEETTPFWAAAREGRLVIEQCSGCHAASMPPRGICRRCRGRRMEWVEVKGPGVVYSYTVNHQRWLPGLEVPYVVVLVEFTAYPGVRVAGRLRGADPAAVRVGMTVQVGFEEGPGGFAIPSFVASPGR